MKIILEVDDALGKAIIQTSTAKELIQCKDCIKKELCSIFRDAKQELGFCAWAARKEE